MCDCENGKAFCQQLSGEYRVSGEFDGGTGGTCLNKWLWAISSGHGWRSDWVSDEEIDGFSRG